MLQRIMSQIAAVKKDMIILEKSEFSALLTENEVQYVRGLLLFDEHKIQFLSQSSKKQFVKTFWFAGGKRNE